MDYEGTVRGGVVVLDPSPTPLPEGARVGIHLTTISPTSQDSSAARPGRTLAELLKGVIGRAVDLPEDAASQHDHYLYGTPKRP